MSAPDESKPAATDSADTDEELDRAAILARRQLLVRRAVHSIGAVMLGVMGSDCAPQPCLSDGRVPVDATSDIADSQPMPCLSPLQDTGTDLGTDASADVPDAEPMPCLSPPIRDE